MMDVSNKVPSHGTTTQANFCVLCRRRPAKRSELSLGIDSRVDKNDRWGYSDAVGCSWLSSWGRVNDRSPFYERYHGLLGRGRLAGTRE